jgi:hypothetical protein
VEFGLFRWDSRPKESRPKKWYMGGFDDIADAKEGHMHAGMFEKILVEFPQSFDCVKPLCRKTRGILFHLLEDESLNIGTPAGPREKLYDAIVEAFNEAIL